MQTTLPTPAPGAPKTCSRPGCTKELRPLNSSGRCSKHFHWKDPQERAATRGNGHATAKANGHAGKSNGVSPKAANVSPKAANVSPKAANGSSRADSRAESVAADRHLAGDFLEDRLNRLILALPVPDKAAIAHAWLKGEI
jgi:hypothetical protein